MAIISCDEIWEAMTLTETAADGYTATRQFRLISDIPNEDMSTVLAHSTLPALGSLLPGSIVLVCTERTPSRTEKSRTEWIVNLSYKSNLNQEERNRIQNSNPLDRSATIEWMYKKSRRAVRRVKKSDYYKTYSKAIESTFQMRAAANSASDPYEPVYEVDVTDWIAVIRKNVTSIPTWFLTYEDAVNNAPFNISFYGATLTIPKGCAKMGGISMPLSKQENGYEYIPLSFQIETRQFRELADGESEAPEPWDDEVLDQGMRTYVDDYGSASLKAWKNVLDVDMNAVTLPVPFDGKGQPVATPGSGKINETDLWWSLIAPYKRKDFSILPLT